MAIKYEAEKTSLQLRLDRCQADLAHFTTEANRLPRSRELKNQFEQETYRELENKVCLYCTDAQNDSIMKILHTFVSSQAKFRTYSDNVQ